MVVELTPKSKQSTPPATFEQTSDFPAAVAAGPATNPTDAMDEVGYVNLHCTPVGSAPPDCVRFRLTATVVPGLALEEPSASVTCCAVASAMLADRSRLYRHNLTHTRPNVLFVLSMETLSTLLGRVKSRCDDLVRSKQLQ
jgi:hypothetical protein